MTKTENTLYILQNLSSTDSEDYLESVEIEVYYEEDQGNEGMSITYDMPTIADEAISTINELEKRIEALEKELSHAQTMGNREQSIRDLEQRVSGMVEVATQRCPTSGFVVRDERSRADILDYVESIKDKS